MLPPLALAEAAPRVARIALEDGISARVTWASPAGLASERVPLALLRAAEGRSRAQLAAEAAAARPQPLLPLSRATLPRFELGALMAVGRVEAGAEFALLRALNEHGAALVTGAPVGGAAADPAAAAPVLALARILSGGIGAMRTLYGESFVVEAARPAAAGVALPINAAFSDVALDLHQDLSYMEAAPGLQLLHCARNDAGVVGGESTLLDAFMAAELLRRRAPAAFAALARLPVAFEKSHIARALPAIMRAERPHFSLRRAGGTSGGHGELVAVTWAPPFEAPLRIACARADLDEYFGARSAFARLLGDLEAGDGRGGLPHGALLETRLEPGEVLVFNNQRMLHGRRAFEARGAGTERRLFGAYVCGDAWKSRLAVLAAAAREHERGSWRMRRIGNGNLL
jgi:gamma-butyrobetaine dioxygenase